MPAVSGRYIVCPFLNTKKSIQEGMGKREGGVGRPTQASGLGGEGEGGGGGAGWGGGGGGE